MIVVNQLFLLEFPSTWTGSMPSSLKPMNNKLLLKYMFSKKTTKIDEIFTVDLRLCSKRQIDGEDFVNFRGLRKYGLYDVNYEKSNIF